MGLPGAVFARALIVTGPVTTCVQVGGVGGPSVEIGCGRGTLVAAETSGLVAFGAGWGLASGFGCVAAGALETGTA